MKRATASTRAALILAAIALAVCAAWWWTRPGADAAGRPRAADAGAAAAPAALPRSQAGGAAPRSWPDLPPLERPLRLAADELRARADAGDPLAACRLVAEADHCDQARELVQHLRRALDQAERMAAHRTEDGETDAEMPKRIRAALAERERALAHCADVATPPPAERVRYARQAALAGHLPSMRHYAIGHAFRVREIMAVLPQLEIYRREAEVMARRAAAAGDLESAAALAAGYLGGLPGQGPFPTLLEQTLPEDPGRALAWAQAALAHPAMAALPEPHPLRVRLDEILAEATDRLPPGARIPEPAAMASAPDGRASGRIASIHHGLTREACSERAFVAP